MIQQFRVSLAIWGLMTLLTGVAYPVLVTAIAQLVFPYQANGSVEYRDGKAIGSELIGQPFSQAGYFWGRLSATSPFAYNAAASTGSNYGPLHPDLKRNAESRMAALRPTARDGSAIPVDLVTSSGSGLDPHISPAAAQLQVDRVAAARQLSGDVVQELVRRHTETREFGVLGEPRVNVLRLNLALDAVSRRD